MHQAIQRTTTRFSQSTNVGFSLIVWGAFGEDNMIQYVSNCHRDETKKYMGDLLVAWDQGMPDIPYHERN